MFSNQTNATLSASAAVAPSTVASSSVRGLTSGAKAGIGLSAVIVAVAVLVAAFFLVSRSRRKIQHKQNASSSDPSDFDPYWNRGLKRPRAELDAESPYGKKEGPDSPQRRVRTIDETFPTSQYAQQPGDASLASPSWSGPAYSTPQDRLAREQQPAELDASSSRPGPEKVAMHQFSSTVSSSLPTVGPTKQATCRPLSQEARSHSEKRNDDSRVVDVADLRHLDAMPLRLFHNNLDPRLVGISEPGSLLAWPTPGSRVDPETSMRPLHPRQDSSLTTAVHAANEHPPLMASPSPRRFSFEEGNESAQESMPEREPIARRTALKQHRNESTTVPISSSTECPSILSAAATAVQSHGLGPSDAGGIAGAVIGGVGLTIGGTSLAYQRRQAKNKDKEIELKETESSLVKRRLELELKLNTVERREEDLDSKAEKIRRDKLELEAKTLSMERERAALESQRQYWLRKQAAQEKENNARPPAGEQTQADLTQESPAANDSKELEADQRERQPQGTDSELQKLQDHHSTLTTKFTELEDENVRLKQDFEVLKMEDAERKRKFQVLQTEKEELERTLEARSASSQGDLDARSMAQEELRVVKNEIEGLHRLIVTAYQTEKGYAKQLTAVQELLHEVREEKEKQKRDHEEEAAALREQCEKLNADLGQNVGGDLERKPGPEFTMPHVVLPRSESNESVVDINYDDALRDALEQMSKLRDESDRLKMRFEALKNRERKDARTQETIVTIRGKMERDLEGLNISLKESPADVDDTRAVLPSPIIACGTDGHENDKMAEEQFATMSTSSPSSESQHDSLAGAEAGSHTSDSTHDAPPVATLGLTSDGDEVAKVCELIPTLDSEFSTSRNRGTVDIPVSSPAGARGEEINQNTQPREWMRKRASETDIMSTRLNLLRPRRQST